MILWPNKNSMELKLAEEAVIKRSDGSATPCIVRLLMRKLARYLFDTYLQFLSIGMLPRIIILKGKWKQRRLLCAKTCRLLWLEIMFERLEQEHDFVTFADHQRISYVCLWTAYYTNVPQYNIYIYTIKIIVIIIKKLSIRQSFEKSL